MAKRDVRRHTEKILKEQKDEYIEKIKKDFKDELNEIKSDSARLFANILSERANPWNL